MKVIRFTMKELVPLGPRITDPTVTAENEAVDRMSMVDDGILVAIKSDPLHPRIVPWSNVAVAVLENEEDAKLAEKDNTQPDGGKHGEKRK